MKKMRGRLLQEGYARREARQVWREGGEKENPQIRIYKRAETEKAGSSSDATHPEEVWRVRCRTGEEVGEECASLLCFRCHVLEL